MNDLLQSVRRNAIGLGLFAMVTAGAIAVAQVGTKERIEHNILMAQAKALNEIVPAGSYDNDLLTDVIAVDNRFNQQLLGPLPDDARIHLARTNGRVTTVILPVVAPDGYTTQIAVLVGVHADGSIAGVRIIEHKETPGLGDKIDRKKSDWVLGFNDKSLTNPSGEGWAVKKDGGDFDQFTGATITPRAVVKAVKLALKFFELHKNELLGQRLTEPQHSGSGE
ncbi:MAG: electron transport complex subunit RsxG [Saccharospirillaceae bacterium]|nr:electron transport complex subunit RsxG [Saccharospirillaceae bacterium]MCD8530273.1 electron transport complex subunit RsxG [Saccharospirillaceae bacterium]